MTTWKDGIKSNKAFFGSFRLKREALLLLGPTFKEFLLQVTLCGGGTSPKHLSPSWVRALKAIPGCDLHLSTLAIGPPMSLGLSLITVHSKMVRNRLFRAQTPSLSLCNVDQSRYIFWAYLIFKPEALSSCSFQLYFDDIKHNAVIWTPSYPMAPIKDSIFWSLTPKQFLNQNPENSIFSLCLHLLKFSQHFFCS